MKHIVDDPMKQERVDDQNGKLRRGRPQTGSGVDVGFGVASKHSTQMTMMRSISVKSVRHLDWCLTGKSSPATHLQARDHRAGPHGVTRTDTVKTYAVLPVARTDQLVTQRLGPRGLSSSRSLRARLSLCA